MDNIITNDTTNKLLPGVIRTDLSDHYAVFSSTLNFSTPNSKDKVIYRRDKLYLIQSYFAET